MNQYTKTVLTFGALVVLLIGLYFFSDWFSKTTGYVLGDDEKANLATCLKSKGALLYVSNTCPDCDEQIRLFGQASRLLDVVVCKSAEECPEGGVPAWKVNNKYYYGLLGLDELIMLSGCSVE